MILQVNRKPEARASMAVLLALVTSLLSSGAAESLVVGNKIQPLSGKMLSDQKALLAQLRLLPKAVKSETREQSSLKARLFMPTATDSTKKYPLVIYLHGGGPRKDFDHLLEGEAPGFAYGIGRFVSSEMQAEHPCFVLAPWSGPQGWDEKNRRLILGMIAKLQTEFRLDAHRIYLTGQSMGGYGTWALVTEHPDLFAAAIPICGGGNPAFAAKAKAVPIWAFHGTPDSLVPVNETRGMVRALTTERGNIRYWEYESGSHAGTAERAYCEPELVTWLFQQSKP